MRRPAKDTISTPVFGEDQIVYEFKVLEKQFGSLRKDPRLLGGHIHQ